MGAPWPVDELSTLVTACTDIVVTFDVVLRLLTVREIGTRSFLFAFRLVNVGFAFAVTTYATWQPAIDFGSVTCFTNTENWIAFILIVATCAFGIAS